MQASRSPWEWWSRDVASERRRVRVSLQDMQQARALQHAELAWTKHALPWPRLRPDITLYSPSQLRELVRLQYFERGEGGVMEGGRVVVPTLPPWLRERHALDAPASWGMAQLPVTYKVEKSPGSSLRWWSGGACAGGAALLALLLLLLRLRDSCRTRRATARRLSDEWATPNVLATSHQSEPVLLGLPEERLVTMCPPAAGINDLPPPYSECAGERRSPPPPPAPPQPPPADPGKQPLAYDEPPPPYSACFVAYYKHGLPTQDSPNTHSQQDSTDPIHAETNQDVVRIEIPADDDIRIQTDGDSIDEGTRNELNDVQNNNVTGDTSNVTEERITESICDGLELRNERLLTAAGVVHVDNLARGIVV